MTDVTVSILNDSATPDIAALQRALTLARVQRAVGTACTVLTKNHLNELPQNKMGWPSTGFYKKAARGTAWNPTSDGVVIQIDTDGAPGAMRQRYYGGTINMKDKLLTIPARAEAYGSMATSFTNLRFVQFGPGGPKALVVDTGGAGQVNFETGQEKNVKGLSGRAVKKAKTRGELIVMFWLKESVTQQGDVGVIPTPDEYIATAKAVINELVLNRRNN